MLADDLLSRFDRPRQTAGGFMVRCPAHDDRNPSLSIKIKDDGQILIHCHAGCSAQEITAAIGLDLRDLFPDSRRPLRRLVSFPVRRAADKLTRWLNRTYLDIAILCREVSRQIALAQELRDEELVEGFKVEWHILSIFHDDLRNPKYAGEMLAIKTTLEQVAEHIALEPPEEFPPITPEYLEYLRSILPGD